MLRLSAKTRSQSLAAMADGVLDVPVIGGGITGAGVALDAASRGLRVGLVEREDIASGTSGRSSRLIHGGPRYLRRGELGLVRESLRERSILRRLAPHLVRPLPFLFPVPRWHQRALAATGLVLYHALAAGRGIARHRWVDQDEADRLAPGRRRATGGYVYWDCRTDDARLTLEVVRAATSFGARVATRAEVVGLLGLGRVSGVRARNRLTDGQLDIRARLTVNATGRGPMWSEACPHPPLRGSDRASGSTSSWIAAACPFGPRSWCRGSRAGGCCCWPSRGGHGSMWARPTTRTKARSTSPRPMARWWRPC